VPSNETQHLGYGVNLKGKKVAVPFSILRSDLSARLRFVAGLITLLWLSVIWALD
jgi:hypothetical protein